MYQLISWAWAAGWFLVSMGMTISDVYSSPNRGLTIAYVMGFAGWAIGAAVTINYMQHQFVTNVYITGLSMAGWTVGALVAVALGLYWLQTWDAGFWGPIVAAAIGGAIGGALTLPIRYPSSLATIVRRSLWGAFSWGVMFLVFQVLAFYAGYILSALTVNRLVPIVGNIWAEVPGWALPAGLAGLHAAWLASRSLRSKEGRLGQLKPD
jgi:hypothetical protein